LRKPVQALKKSPINEHPAVFFHVGLGKVASTFLQYRFFPQLTGLCYIQRTRYRQAPQIIREGNCYKYLVSREFDRQLKEEVQWFAGHYPRARPILLLRRHDQWIASQYRRYVKNGGHLKLEEFLDLDSDQGRWKQEEVYFMPYIHALEQAFAYSPLVLFYEDFKQHPKHFYETLAGYLGAGYHYQAIDQRPFHASYTEKQLKYMRKYGSRLFCSGRALPSQPLLRWLKRRSEMLTSYLLLYAAKLAPAGWVSREILYPQAYMERIRAFYQADWEACQAYGKPHRPEGITDHGD